jgi:hypothetical protein
MNTAQEISVTAVDQDGIPFVTHSSRLPIFGQTDLVAVVRDYLHLNENTYTFHVEERLNKTLRELIDATPPVVLSRRDGLGNVEIRVTQTRAAPDQKRP